VRALAETMGDAHRQKMPHGPVWNRLNMVGQVILAVALLLGALRTLAWIWPGSWAQRRHRGRSQWMHPLGMQTNYYWIVDVASRASRPRHVLHFSGRVWCRFACPLAALMHVYARLSTLPHPGRQEEVHLVQRLHLRLPPGDRHHELSRTRACPMEDPQCVRCSACVASCPTDVLTFGRVNRSGSIISVDSLRAK
jgi:ferredoxin